MLAVVAITGLRFQRSIKRPAKNNVKAIWRRMGMTETISLIRQRRSLFRRSCRRRAISREFPLSPRLCSANHSLTIMLIEAADQLKIRLENQSAFSQMAHSGGDRGGEGVGDRSP